MRRSQACKGASRDTDAAGRDTKDVVSIAVCGNQALFGAIGAVGTNWIMESSLKRSLLSLLGMDSPVALMDMGRR